MKKCNLLFAFVCIMFASTNAQNLKKTFYDLNGTKPKEVYYVNAKGEKNGSYKSYFDDGLIGVEANYKNGSFDGVYKEYTGYGGKSCLVKSVTYKDGEANGAAIYYSNQQCNVIASQGNLVNGKRNGVWTFFEETSKSFAEGFRYMTYTQKVDGDVVLEDSKIVYYHPSKKIFSEFKGNVKVSYSPDGKVMGEETFNEKKELLEEKYYYLSGAVAENNKYYVDGGNKISEKTSWYENGKLKKKEKYSNGSNLLAYEGYKEDGSKDANMTNFEKNNKTGKFKIFLDERGKVIEDEKKCAYYREIEYSNGKPIGVVKDYYSTGQLQGESTLKSENPDVAVGVVKLYYKNGKLQALLNNDNTGQLNGKVVSYYETGKTSDSSFYEFGVLKYSISYNVDSKKTEEIKQFTPYDRTNLMKKGVEVPSPDNKMYFLNQYFPNGNLKVKANITINPQGKRSFFGTLERFSESGALEKSEIYDSSGGLKK